MPSVWRCAVTGWSRRPTRRSVTRQPNAPPRWRHATASTASRPTSPTAGRPAGPGGPWPRNPASLPRGCAARAETSRTPRGRGTPTPAPRAPDAGRAWCLAAPCAGPTHGHQRAGPALWAARRHPLGINGRYRPELFRSELRGDRLDLGVGLQHLVAHLATPAGLLVPAERECRVEHVVAVDPHRAGPELLGQGVGLGDVPGPDARAEAVVGVVGLGRDLVEVAERGGDHHRPEDLLTHDLHVGGGVGDHCGLDEVAAVAEPAAAGDGGGAVRLAGLQVAGDPLQLLVGDQWPHLGARLHPGAELDGLGDLGDAVHDLVEAALLHEQAGAGDTALAVVEED